MSDQVGNPEDWFSHNEAHFFISVCPTLDFDDTKVSANTSEDGSKVEFYCSGTGQKFAKIDGTKSPNTIFECRPDTDYEWEPSMITPQCASKCNMSRMTTKLTITIRDFF